MLSEVDGLFLVRGGGNLSLNLSTNSIGWEEGKS